MREGVGVVRAIRRRQAIFMAKFEVVLVGGGEGGKGFVDVDIGGGDGGGGVAPGGGNCGSWRNGMMWVFL